MVNKRMSNILIGFLALCSGVSMFVSGKRFDPFSTDPTAREIRDDSHGALDEAQEAMFDELQDKRQKAELAIQKRAQELQDKTNKEQSIKGIEQNLEQFNNVIIQSNLKKGTEFSLSSEQLPTTALTVAGDKNPFALIAATARGQANVIGQSATAVLGPEAFTAALTPGSRFLRQ